MILNNQARPVRPRLELVQNGRLNERLLYQLSDRCRFLSSAERSDTTRPYAASASFSKLFRLSLTIPGFSASGHRHFHLLRVRCLNAWRFVSLNKPVRSKFYRSRVAGGKRNQTVIEWSRYKGGDLVATGFENTVCSTFIHSGFRCPDYQASQLKSALQPK